MGDPNQNGQATNDEIGALRLTLDAFRKGQAGIAYDQLTRFAEPLLAFYNLDLRAVLHAPVTAQNHQEAGLLIDILSTAYQFWSYCRLPEAERQRALPALREDLLGADATQEDLDLFPQLVHEMETSWDRLSAASAPGIMFEMGTPANPALNGHQLPPPPGDADAFALFARPLFEATDLTKDPDLLEDVTQRAEVYWDLAQFAPDARTQQLERLIDQWAQTEDEAEVLRTEALHMMRRFDQLFQDPT